MDCRFADRRRLAPAILAIALSLSLASPALAVDVTFEDMQSSTADLHVCGVHISGSANLHVNDGVGVIGGLGSSLVDGTESIAFDFDEPQRGVEFEVAEAWDLDGDLISGRMIVEAWDAGGASMGFQLIQDTGVKDLASLYGAAAMSRVVVTALADGIRIARLGYDEVGPVEIDLIGGGYANINQFTPTVCGVRFVGSGQVYYDDIQSSSTGGMGVVGGESAIQLDGSEWMRLEFPYPVDELVLESLLYSYDTDFWYGEAVLFAYDESGSSLGSTSLQRHSLFGGPVAQTVDVVALLGTGGISEIEIFSLGDGRTLENVLYAPEPSAGAGFALLLLVGLSRRRTRERESQAGAFTALDRVPLL